MAAARRSATPTFATELSDRVPVHDCHRRHLRHDLLVSSQHQDRSLNPSPRDAAAAQGLRDVEVVIAAREAEFSSGLETRPSLYLASTLAGRIFGAEAGDTAVVHIGPYEAEAHWLMVDDLVAANKKWYDAEDVILIGFGAVYYDVVVGPPSLSAAEAEIYSALRQGDDALRSTDALTAARAACCEVASAEPATP